MGVDDELYRATSLVRSLTTDEQGPATFNLCHAGFARGFLR